MDTGGAVRAFPDPPVLIPIRPGTWQLMSDYVVPAFGFSMRIPAEFVTDLASVPHILRSLVGTEDCGAVGAIAHDYLYQYGGRASGLVEPLRRVRVDRLFRVLMQLENVLGWRRWVAWAAVRAAGWLCWRDYKDEGEGKNAMIVSIVEAVKQAVAALGVTFGGAWASLAGLAAALKVDVAAGKQAVFAAGAAIVAAVLMGVGNLVKQWRAKVRPSVDEAVGLLVEAQEKIERALGAL